MENAKQGANKPEMQQDADAELIGLAALSEKGRIDAIEKLVKTGDYKAVAAFSRKLDIADKAAEKANLAVKTAALDVVRARIAIRIDKIVQQEVDSKSLDMADGIWYAFDFGDKVSTTRLTKTAPKATRAGGAGKTFDVTTVDMLTRHGEKQFKDGRTYQQAWNDSNDKNSRFHIRQILLKLDGRVK